VRLHLPFITFAYPCCGSVSTAVEHLLLFAAHSTTRALPAGLYLLYIPITAPAYAGCWTFSDKRCIFCCCSTYALVKLRTRAVRRHCIFTVHTRHTHTLRMPCALYTRTTWPSPLVRTYHRLTLYTFITLCLPQVVPLPFTLPAFFFLHTLPHTTHTHHIAGYCIAYTVGWLALPGSFVARFLHYTQPLCWLCYTHLVVIWIITCTQLPWFCICYCPRHGLRSYYGLPSLPSHLVVRYDHLRICYEHCHCWIVTYMPLHCLRCIYFYRCLYFACYPFRRTPTFTFDLHYTFT